MTIVKLDFFKSPMTSLDFTCNPRYVGIPKNVSLFCLVANLPDHTSFSMEVKMKLEYQLEISGSE
jgi:hypothetical protein